MSFPDELCPKNGKCDYQILKNKTISLHNNSQDEFYPTISDEKNLVFKFEYKRNEIPNTQDGDYREEIFIELDPNNLEFTTSNLQKEKVIFTFSEISDNIVQNIEIQHKNIDLTISLKAF